MVYVIAAPMIEGKINAKDKRIHFADVSRFVNALWSKITTSVSIAETIAPIILERLVYLDHSRANSHAFSQFYYHSYP